MIPLRPWSCIHRKSLGLHRSESASTNLLSSMSGLIKKQLYVCSFRIKVASDLDSTYLCSFLCMIMKTSAKFKFAPLSPCNAQSWPPFVGPSPIRTAPISNRIDCNRPSCQQHAEQAGGDLVHNRYSRGQASADTFRNDVWDLAQMASDECRLPRRSQMICVFLLLIPWVRYWFVELGRRGILQFL